MLSRKANTFVFLTLGAALVGSCFAEGSHRPIFQSEGSSGTLQTAVVDNAHIGQLSDASLRAASSEELGGMEQTLDKYRTAFESLSLPQMREVWPGLDRRRASALKDVFAYLRTSKAAPQLGLECAPPMVAGGLSNVTCRETLAYSDSRGHAKQAKPAMVSIQLKKQPDSWVVETMNGVGKAK